MWPCGAASGSPACFSVRCPWEPKALAKAAQRKIRRTYYASRASDGVSPKRTLPLLRLLLEPHHAIRSADQTENRPVSTPSADAFHHWNVVRFPADSMDSRSFQQGGGPC